MEFGQVLQEKSEDEIVLKLGIEPKTIQTYPEVLVEAPCLVPETYAVLQSEDEIVLKLGIEPKTIQTYPEVPVEAQTYAVLQSEDEIVLKLGIEPKTIQTYPEVLVEARIRLQSTHCHLVWYQRLGWTSSIAISKAVKDVRMDCVPTPPVHDGWKEIIILKPVGALTDVSAENTTIRVDQLYMMAFHRGNKRPNA
ncbi:hypothetical protein J6590_031296 [Homalodisca vitripennis]|nr:hypothetical protein J6590_031296 [Homalodisca vitripennis]